MVAYCLFAPEVDTLRRPLGWRADRPEEVFSRRGPGFLLECDLLGFWVGGAHMVPLDDARSIGKAVALLAS